MLFYSTRIKIFPAYPSGHSREMLYHVCIEKNLVSRVDYIEPQHLKNFQDNYQNVCYIEVKLIINLQNPAFPDQKNYCYNISVPSQYIATTLETQEQANNTA